MKLDSTFTKLPLRSSFNYKTIVDNYFSKTLNIYIPILVTSATSAETFPV